MSNANDIFNFEFPFGSNGIDGWMTTIKSQAEKNQIAKEVGELVEKNPEYIYKIGVIDSMIKQLNTKISELDRMKVEIRVEIANRIISSGAEERWKGYKFAIPPRSASIFGSTTDPVVEEKKDE